jgi:hypothetical protein
MESKKTMLMWLLASVASVTGMIVGMRLRASVQAMWKDMPNDTPAFDWMSILSGGFIAMCIMGVGFVLWAALTWYLKRKKETSA